MTLPILTLPILIAGLILRLTNGWFNGQHTVGDICLWIGGVGIAIQLVIMLLVFLGVIAAARR